MEPTSFPALALIPLLPLLGAILNGLLGWWLQRRFGRAAVHVPAVVLPALSFVVTVWAFAYLALLPGEGEALHVSVWRWIDAGPVVVDMAFGIGRAQNRSRQSGPGLQREKNPRHTGRLDRKQRKGQTPRTTNTTQATYPTPASRSATSSGA